MASDRVGHPDAMPSLLKRFYDAAALFKPRPVCFDSGAGWSIPSMSAPTVAAALVELQRIGILEEATGRCRGRIFGYRSYLAILSEGTDPIS